MNDSRMSNYRFFSPLWKRGAGGDSSFFVRTMVRGIPPSPPFPKGGMCVWGCEA
jgi:hypothetical protein